MSKKPKYRIYGVAVIGGISQKREIWTRMGAIWENPHSGQLSGSIEAIPVNFTGGIVIHLADDDRDQDLPDEGTPF